MNLMKRTMSIPITITVRVTGDIEDSEDDAYFARVVGEYVDRLIRREGALCSEDVCEHRRWAVHFGRR